ncbi:MAG: hypothetical protein OEZ22_13635 [Spirochaetia bacterium]|nr:hypothetical protein [Spirochaetia bacterium]
MEACATGATPCRRHGWSGFFFLCPTFFLFTQKERKWDYYFDKNFYQKFKKSSTQRNDSPFSGYLYNMKGKKEENLPQEESVIAKKILTLRGRRVMLDRD